MSRFEEAFYAMQRGVTVEPENIVSPAWSSTFATLSIYAGFATDGPCYPERTCQDYKKYAEELRKKSGISQPAAVETEPTVDEKKPIEEDVKPEETKADEA